MTDRLFELAVVRCPYKKGTGRQCRKPMANFVRYDGGYWFVHLADGQYCTRVFDDELHNDWVFVDNDVCVCVDHPRQSKMNGREVTRAMLGFRGQWVREAAEGRRRELVPLIYEPTIRARPEPQR